MFTGWGTFELLLHFGFDKWCVWHLRLNPGSSTSLIVILPQSCDPALSFLRQNLTLYLRLSFCLRLLSGKRYAWASCCFVLFLVFDKVYYAALGVLELAI